MIFRIVSVVSLMFLSSFRQVSILSGLLFSWSYWYFRGLLWQAYVILKTLNVKRYNVKTLIGRFWKAKEPQK